MNPRIEERTAGKLNGLYKQNTLVSRLSGLVNSEWICIFPLSSETIVAVPDIAHFFIAMFVFEITFAENDSK